MPLTPREFRMPASVPVPLIVIPFPIVTAPKPPGSSASPASPKAKTQVRDLRALGSRIETRLALLFIRRRTEGTRDGIADQGIALEGIDRAAVCVQSGIIVGDNTVRNPNGIAG